MKVRKTHHAHMNMVFRNILEHNFCPKRYIDWKCTLIFSDSLNLYLIYKYFITFRISQKSKQIKYEVEDNRSKCIIVELD